MRAMMVEIAGALRRIALAAAVGAGLALVTAAQAAVPGIRGAAGTPVFNLVAAPGYISQPDGTSIYSWGYGCSSLAGNVFLPANVPNAKCPAGRMQLPGPTLIVHQGNVVTVNLTNSLPAAAGTTSILFPGFNVTATGGVTGLLAREAVVGGTVSYTFTASTPGTHVYYSGTRGDLQVEMGLYGALIVLPSGSGGTPLNGAVPSAYVPPTAGMRLPNTCRALAPTAPNGHADYRLAAAAYNHPSACYDREYLFMFSTIDPGIHRQAENQRGLPCPAARQATGCTFVITEPYTPAYFMVNGRSMPDLMDPNYAVQYPNQPYNANPHIHPGEHMLLRISGTGRWQHPFHQHGNHVRVLARDGNLLLTPTGKLAGPLLFTTSTTPGQTIDAIFQWTGKGLNWDVYAHASGITTDVCNPDANGYYTAGSGAPPTAPNYYEWCGDHGKALEAKPFGAVGSGGPVTLPDANLFALGPWYGGSPYLGAEATARAAGVTPVPPSGTVANSEASFAYMWHSHNEREITTNNAFPGGMMMMMLVDHWLTVINEAN